VETTISGRASKQGGAGAVEQRSLARPTRGCRRNFGPHLTIMRASSCHHTPYSRSFNASRMRIIKSVTCVSRGRSVLQPKRWLVNMHAATATGRENTRFPTRRAAQGNAGQALLSNVTFLLSANDAGTSSCRVKNSTTTLHSHQTCLDCLCPS
jgi:hypothetical protein